jgi:predicted nuclease of predicted toxin-antitoxin system
MKFIVDAHLPRRIALRLRAAGHDALHTLELPNGNRTTDSEINMLSLREERIVVTKDADFVNSILLSHQPYKLRLISTGNIKNADLDALITSQLPAIVAAFATYDYLELSRSSLIVHY